MTAHALSCEQVLALLSDYLDGELDASSLAAVEAHLHVCRDCTKFGGQFRATVAALREHLKGAPGLPTRLRARLASLLDAEEQDRDA